jgi:hypothetical protein
LTSIAHKFLDQLRRLGCPHLAYIAALRIHHRGGPHWCQTTAGIAHLRGLHRTFGLPADTLVCLWIPREPPSRKLGDWDLPPPR